jgi:hypothetical protein
VLCRRAISRIIGNLCIDGKGVLAVLKMERSDDHFTKSFSFGDDVNMMSCLPFPD